MTTTTETRIETDILSALTGISSGDARDRARDRRPESREHTQGSFEALFIPVDASQVSLVERAAVALFVARLHRQTAAVEFYGALLRHTGGERLEALIVAEARHAAGEGPYGAFRAENSIESVTGPEYSVDSVEAAYALGDRLAAALEHAHLLVLHPRDAQRATLQRLLDAGWSTTGIVTLSQLVAFLAFQLRVAQGLGELRVADGGETAKASDLTELAAQVARIADERRREEVWESAAANATGPARAAETAEQLPPIPKVVEPPRFTQDVLGWKPWLEPLPVAEFTERHYEALVERERVHMPYFRVLARDPEALLERTLTDLDIFTNTDAGLPRADREIAAAAASRFNGCVFCASVHARFATEHGADSAEVQRLLDEGIDTEFAPRWNAIIGATVALTATPPVSAGSILRPCVGQDSMNSNYSTSFKLAPSSTGRTA
ncbi:CMD domain protein [Leucobacter coleopterorum]|uniref:CMD domain protein n=1 Tax=Leucobacter coleopterorum TaxID=2714933 RepID=UPI001FCBA83E|nr:CMD domain protein [Leucobacter coleopterorum]